MNQFLGKYTKLWITLFTVLILYFSLVGFWTGFYTKRKIIHDIKARTGLNLAIGYSHIYPFTGNGTMKNIRILNPPGYITKQALSIAEIKFTGNTKSLYSEDIQLNQLEVHGIELNIDIMGGQTNFSRLASMANKSYRTYYGSHDVGFKTIRANRLSIDQVVFNLGPKIFNNKPTQLTFEPVILESVGTEQGDTLQTLGVKLAKAYVQNAENMLKTPPPGLNENLAAALNVYIGIAKGYLDQK